MTSEHTDPSIALENDLHISVGRTFDDPPIGREEWDQFVLDSDSDLYFTFDWCRIWWKHYGSGRKLCLLAFRSEGKLVGLMPMIIDRAGVLGARAKLAKFVGSDSTISVLLPAIAPGWHEKVAASTISHMLDVERCDAVWFGPLSGEGNSAQSIRAACSTHPSAELAMDRSPGVHTIFLLPDSFDKYLASLESKARYNYQRSVKQLAKGRVVNHVLVEEPGQVNAYFDEFVSLHARQWNALNQPGHFGDWPRSEDFTRDLIEQMAPQKRVRFLNLIADETMLSRNHCFRFGKHIHWRLPARELGAEWDKLSIGSMALVMSIETAISQGLTRIEGGPGHYEYKVRYGAKEFPLTSLLVVRRAIGSLIRSRILCTMSDLLNLLYYRIWRLRLAPRLSRRPRPLWYCWMRSRL